MGLYNTYTPVFQTEFMISRFVDSRVVAELLASGVLDMNTLESYGPIVGDYVNIPKLAHVPDFQHVDVTSDTPVTPTKISSNDDKFPILHDDTILSWKDSQIPQIGEPELIPTKQVASVGEKWARRFAKQVFAVLKASIPTAKSLDKSTSVATVQHIRALKRLAGDGGYEFDTLIVHSDVWAALLYDMLNTYSANPSIAGAVALDGRTRSLLGFSNIIISDNVPYTAGGIATPNANVYTTFACRPGSVLLGYQQTPKTDYWKNILVPGNANYMKVQLSYILGLSATKWTGSANPVDADLANSSNWGTSYSDAREIGALKVTHTGVVGG